MIVHEKEFDLPLKIKEVQVSDKSDYVSITTTTSMGFGLEKSACIEKLGRLPKVGDLIQFRGSFGRPVAGVRVNDVTIWDKTDEEMEADHQKWVREWHEKQKAEFARDRERLDAEFEALPEPFKRRITRFREADPDFRWHSESYEMMPLTEAANIVQHLKTPEEIDDFAKNSWNEDGSKKIPFSDGHSGNTFGAACMFAKLLLTDPDKIK